MKPPHEGKKAARRRDDDKRGGKRAGRGEGARSRPPACIITCIMRSRAPQKEQREGGGAVMHSRSGRRFHAPSGNSRAPAPLARAQALHLRRGSPVPRCSPYARLLASFYIPPLPVHVSFADVVQLGLADRVVLTSLMQLILCLNRWICIN